MTKETKIRMNRLTSKLAEHDFNKKAIVNETFSDEDMEMFAISDSKESFEANKEYLLKQIEERIAMLNEMKESLNGIEYTSFYFNK